MFEEDRIELTINNKKNASDTTALSFSKEVQQAMHARLFSLSHMFGCTVFSL